MSRGWLVVAAVVVAGGLAVALATGVFDGDGGAPSTSIGAADASTVPTTVVPSTTAAGPTTTTAPATTLGEDPLCVAYSDFEQTINGHLPVADAEDLEIYLTAAVDFYTEAVDLVESAERDAFVVFLAYQQAQSDFSEGHGWNPSPPLEELLETPPPTAPAEATQVVAGVLESRCGVEIVRE